MTEQSPPEIDCDSPPSHSSGRPSPTWRLKLFALLFSLAAALAAGEVFVRIAFSNEVDTEYLRELGTKIVHMEGLCRPCKDPDMRYELTPGLYQEWGTQIAASHPTESVRISTLYYPPANPAFRIALIGDSTSFGHGLFHESTYASVLRSKLEQTYGMPIELRNYSLPAYNSTQERAIFEDRVAPWKPDLLILHYDHNDCSENSYGFLAPEFGDNFLHSALLKFSLRRLRHIRWNIEATLYARNAKKDHRKTGQHVSGGHAFESHLAELRRIGEGTGEMGLPAVALIFDWSVTPHERLQDDPHFTELHLPLVHHLGASGFHVLDLYSDYQDIMRENRWSDLLPLSLDDSDRQHPNEKGHAFIAGHLHDFIVNHPDLDPLLEKASRNALEKPSIEDHRTLTEYRAGLQAYRARQFAEAERHFRLVAARMPDRLEVKLNLARTLRNLRQNDQALALFYEVLRSGHEFPATHLVVGEILVEKGRHKEALEIHFQSVLNSRTSPYLKGRAALNMAKAASYLAKAFATQGDPEEAAALLRQVATYLATKNQTEAIAPLREIADIYSAVPSQATSQPPAPPPGDR